MFRDRQQASAAMRALLHMVGLRELWSPEGPTAGARELLALSGQPLSPGARTMLFCVWSLWNGKGHVGLRDLAEFLDHAHAGALCLLILAMQDGAAAVDEWIRDYAPPLD